MSIQSNWVCLHVVFVKVVVSEANEVGHVPFELLVFVLDFCQILLQSLVLINQTLPLFIYDPHLVNQILSCTSLILLILQPCKPLVGLEQLSLVLLDNCLVLLPGSVQLQIVTVDFVLEV